MKQYFKVLLCAITLFSTPFFISSYAAADSVTITFENYLKCNTVGECIQLAASAVEPIAKVIFPAIMIIGGILFMVSTGNPERLKKATQTIQWAAVGYAVILLAGFSSDVINAIVGGETGDVKTKITDIIIRFSALLADIGVVLVPVMVLWGAYIWMTSAGEPEKVKKGRNILVWAAIGLAIILLVDVLGNVVQEIATPAAGVTGSEKIIKVLTNLADFIFKILGALSFVVTLVGAFVLMTSAGEPEQVKKGKKIIVWGLVGLAVSLFYLVFAGIVAEIIGGGGSETTCPGGASPCPGGPPGPLCPPCD